MRWRTLLGLWLLGCSTDLPVPPELAAQELPELVGVSPTSPQGAVAPVLHIEIEPRGMAPEAFHLFEGALSDYHLRRLVQNDWPATLVEREIPSVRWLRTDGRVVLAPERVLTSDAEYSVAAASGVELGVLRVAPVDERASFQRVWPPFEPGYSAELMVYCSNAATLLPDSVVLAPAGVPYAVVELPPKRRDGFSRCVALTALEPVSVGAVVLPPLFDDAVFTPAGVEHRPAEPMPGASCEGVAVLGACLEVFDDRVVMRAQRGPSLWVWRSPFGDGLVSAAGSYAWAVPGLPAEADVPFEFAMADGSRGLVERAVVVTTPPVSHHVIINEVLANAMGPEPQSEWVELLNVGAQPVSLEGWTIEDVGGRTELPAVHLPPFEFVLVASADFAPDVDYDVMPRSGTPVLTVAALGRSGLSNAGELLRLRDATGEIHSRFPSVESPVPGVSVSRRSPFSVDDELSDFRLSAPPGASPGSHNSVE